MSDVICMGTHALLDAYNKMPAMPIRPWISSQILAAYNKTPAIPTRTEISSRIHNNMPALPIRQWISSAGQALQAMRQPNPQRLTEDQIRFRAELVNAAADRLIARHQLPAGLGQAPINGQNITPAAAEVKSAEAAPIVEEKRVDEPRIADILAEQPAEEENILNELIAYHSQRSKNRWLERCRFFMPKQSKLEAAQSVIDDLTNPDQQHHYSAKHIAALSEGNLGKIIKNHAAYFQGKPLQNAINEANNSRRISRMFHSLPSLRMRF